MSLKPVNQTTTVAVCLLLGLLAVCWPVRAAVDDQPADRALRPPHVLIDAGLIPVEDAGLMGRAAMTWAQVKKAVVPTPWSEVETKPIAALSPQAADRLKQAESALRNGEVFAAIQDLRQAEQTDPHHPEVVRALGLAYAQSGNLKRAAIYLGATVSAKRGDVEALLVLCRHASQSESIEQALAYCLLLEKSDAPALLANIYRSEALHRLGYTTAAMSTRSAAIQAVDQIDLAKLNKEAELPAALLRELSVVKAMLPQMRIELGDFYLQLRDYARAAKAYADVQVEDAPARRLLAARRVYLAMLAGDQDTAVDQVVWLLGAADVAASDAALVDYLVEQGIPAPSLANRIFDVLAKEGVSLPRLSALSRVAEKHAVLAPIDVWLSSEPLTPQRLEHAAGLVVFDDSDANDAKPLADLLVLIAEQITRMSDQSPDQSLDYARAAVGAIDAPVTLLRAIQSDVYTTDQSDTRKLVAAAAYEATGRRRDAQKAYAKLLSADEALSKQVLIPVIRLQLALGILEEPLVSLGEPDLDADWTVFDLSLRAMAVAGQSEEAIDVVDRYIKANGKQLKADVLRIELIAEVGRPMEACNLLLRLITSNPTEESLYHLGINLAYGYSESFSRPTDADRMVRAFLTRLAFNLPESSFARIGMAQDLWGNPLRQDEAKQLLLDVLEQEPDNVVALSVLVDMYDETGQADAAATMHERYTQALGPGISRALSIADRAVSKGQMLRAKEVLERAIELDEQGVLPGPAVAGYQASALLGYLEVADPKRPTDGLYLAMVRRFPNDPVLNNSLGYRWAVENKNLRQAEAMIQRALQQEPSNHSLLDSLAWVQYKLGDFEKAYATQSRALAMLAQSPVVEEESGSTIAILNDHMGDILYKREDPEAALKYWREAMKPDYTEDEMLLDPELRSLAGRLKAKVDALAAGRPVPVAAVPGPETHGPKGHPADIEPAD